MRKTVTLDSDAGALVAAGVVYFLAVFACGFILGVVRTLWLVPRIGERWAELAEIPVMLGVVVVTARWVVRLFALHRRHAAAAPAAGVLALTLLLTAELGVVLHLRGLTLATYLAERDPISGVAYAASLLLFAAMPALVAGRLRFAA